MMTASSFVGVSVVDGGSIMAQQDTKGDVLQRIASVGFILGAILLIVFNVLYPRADDPSNVQQVLAKLADNETLSQTVFLGLAVGIWSLMVGATGLHRSITDGAGAAWVSLGFYGVVVGTTLFTMWAAIGLAETGAAVAGNADVGATLYALALSNLYMFVVVYWLALVFLGIGIASSDVYPKWLGWILIPLGVATVVVSGVGQALNGITQTSDLIFAALATLTMIWALVIGGIILRRQMKLM